MRLKRLPGMPARAGTAAGACGDVFVAEARAACQLAHGEEMSQDQNGLATPAARHPQPCEPELVDASVTKTPLRPWALESCWLLGYRTADSIRGPG